MNNRLTKGDWLAHGLQTLAGDGANGLRVASMAKALNVSRGSFYWHFRDITDFRGQLLQNWLEETTEHVIRRIEAREHRPHRLRSLLLGAFAATPGNRRTVAPWLAEDAIRSWAADDDEVAAMVASVDDRRLTYIADLLVAQGIPEELAFGRATILYWAYLGRGRIPGARYSSVSAKAVDDMVQLAER